MRLAMLATFALLGVLGSSSVSRAQSLWDRRDPKTVYLFQDYRARQVGDTLTIVVSEVTEHDAQETRNMNKQTLTSANVTANASSQVGITAPIKQYIGTLGSQTQTQRKFDGQANSTIDRKFGDKLSVIVIDVLPNGNLIIEGHRERVVGHEKRMLRVTGQVRPADIGPFNQVQSQYIANFRVIYDGRGPDTNYTNQGWGGRLFNAIWPF